MVSVIGTVPPITASKFSRCPEGKILYFGVIVRLSREELEKNFEEHMTNFMAPLLENIERYVEPPEDECKFAKGKLIEIHEIWEIGSGDKLVMLRVPFISA